jgi:hypothetical protein
MVRRSSRRRRRSSPQGITERLEARIRAWTDIPLDIRKGFRKPGSRNVRKG